MRNVVILISSMALLLTVAIATSRPDVARATTLGTLTVSDDLRISQSDPAAPTPVIAQVQDLFNAAPTEVNGRVTTYDIGDGAFSATGPTWNTRKNAATVTGVWTQAGSTVTRTDSGANEPTMALVPWLQRRSQITVDLQNISNAANRRPDAGVVLNADQTGASGIAAVATCAAGGTCSVGIYIINTATTKTLCGTAQDLTVSNSPSAIDITFTYEPSATGDDATAVFTRTGGGGGASPRTRTCEPSVAEKAVLAANRYAGLYSNLEGQTAVRFSDPRMSLV